MRAFRLDHLSDAVLLRELAALAGRVRAATALLLAHIAEVDARRLYLPAGYPSMFLYCASELHLSEEAAFKRIHAARAARRFPEIFEAVAEGRLHLSAVVMLAPHLTPETIGELLQAATHKTKSEIEQLLAQRFPRPDLPARVRSLAPPADLGLAGTAAPGQEHVSELSKEHAPGRAEAPASRPKVTPLAPERFALQVTIDQRTHEKLRHAQALLSHALPSGDLAQVLDRALDALIGQLERRKLGAAKKPRPPRASARERRVPAHVRRVVWARDQAQCTYVSASGRRCSARKFLELDHVEPVARGGRSTVTNLRLRCRQHNDYEARRMFGAGFMDAKRRAAAEERQATRARVEEARTMEVRTAEARAEAAREQERDVMAGLRELGVRGDEARRAVAFSQSLQDVTLEERMRAALRFLCPKTSRANAAVGI
jgi:hypothetical protein